MGVDIFATLPLSDILELVLDALRFVVLYQLEERPLYHLAPYNMRKCDTVRHTIQGLVHECLSALALLSFRCSHAIFRDQRRSLTRSLTIDVIIQSSFSNPTSAHSGCHNRVLTNNTQACKVLISILQLTAMHDDDDPKDLCAPRGLGRPSRETVLDALTPTDFLIASMYPRAPLPQFTLKIGQAADESFDLALQWALLQQNSDPQALIPDDQRFGIPTAQYPGTASNLPAYLLLVLRSLGTLTGPEDLLSLEICLGWLLKLVTREEDHQQLLIAGSLWPIISMAQDTSLGTQIPTYDFQTMAHAYSVKKGTCF